MDRGCTQNFEWILVKGGWVGVSVEGVGRGSSVGLFCILTSFGFFGSNMHILF